jgi:hypothetical protein
MPLETFHAGLLIEIMEEANKFNAHVLLFPGIRLCYYKYHYKQLLRIIVTK